MDVNQIFSLTRDCVNDPLGRVFDSANMSRALDEAYTSAIAGVLQELNAGFSMCWVDITISADFQDIGGGVLAWLPPFELAQIRKIEKQTPDGQLSIFPTLLGQKDAYYNRPANLRYTAECWFPIGNRIGVRSDIGTDLNLRIYYVRSLPKLSLGVVQAATANTLTLQATPTIGETVRRNDYYNEARLLIVSGATPSVAGQQRTVVDYLAYSSGNAVVTVFPAWTTVPALNDVYSFVPEFPETHHPMISYRMAMSLAKRRGNGSLYQLNQADYQSAEMRFRSDMKSRQDQEPRQVVDVEDSY